MGSTLALVRNLLFVVAVGVFLQVNDFTLSARAVPILCEEVCTESTECAEPCYENMMEFENGNAITCLEWGVWDESANCCGDYFCNADPSDSEVESCEFDCGSLDGCNDCNPTTQQGCSSGQVCNSHSCCVDIPNGYGPDPPIPPVCYDDYCEDSGDCCSGNKCYIGHPDHVSTGVCVPDLIILSPSNPSRKP